MAAIASAASLAMVLLIDPWFWFLMRLIAGICFASLFATVESWLNARVNNSNRARTLSIYRLVDLGSVTAAQYLIPTVGIEGFQLFAIVSMALTLSLVPISFADRSSPGLPEAIKFDVKALWNISPLATIGCIVVGLTNSTFRSLGPIYAEGIGLSITAIATFMSVGIIGGVVLQYPLGLYSDRLDRRLIILFATFGSLLAGLYLALFAGSDEWLNFIGIFIFGAFAMPLYSLCSAHANDHAAEGQHALVSGRHAVLLVLRGDYRAAICLVHARYFRAAGAVHLYGRSPCRLHALYAAADDGPQWRAHRRTLHAVSQPAAHLLFLQQAGGTARGQASGLEEQRLRQDARKCQLMIAVIKF